MPTPGAPIVWCFAAGREMELSVTVDRESISVYLDESERAVELANVGELVAWLSANWPGSLEGPKPSVVDKLRRGRLFRWD